MGAGNKTRKADDNTRLVRGLETIIGGKLIKSSDTVFANPETERRYRELMRRGAAKKSR